MKAPLSQNFKLSQQPTYKRSVLEDSSSAGFQRDIKQRIPLSASSRGGPGSTSIDQDMFNRKMVPENSQHLGGTFSNQDPYTRQGMPQTSQNQNYRSIQQPSTSGNYRSPSAGYQGFQTSTSQHYDRNNNEFLQTYSSRDGGGAPDSQIIKMSGGGYYPKAQVSNTQQNTAEKYGFSSDRYSLDRQQANFSNYRGSHNTNNRDHLLSHSVDQYQPIMADHSPQIVNRGQPSGIIRDFNPSSYTENERKSSLDPYITSQRDNINNNQRQQNQMENYPSKTHSYVKHNRLMSNETFPGQTHFEFQQPGDVEQAVLNLRSKVKTLESKYIDLANFYKKELVNQTQNQISYQGNKSPFRQGEYMDSQSRYYNTSLEHDRSRSPIRSSIEPRIDQNTEKELINDLLSEKKDLENEISAIVECLQKIQEENEINHEKLAQLDNQKKQLQHNKPASQESIAQVKNQVQQILDNFESEFLDFINQNYQSFTENDVLGLFGNLKAQIKQMVDDIKFDRKDSGRQPFSQVQSNEQTQMFDTQRQQLLNDYQKELNEFELNNEYTIQKIKKNTFELQNKNEITKLDLKKALLTLSNLQKTSGELQQLANGSFERHGSAGLNKSNKSTGGVLDMRTSANYGLNHSSAPQNQQLIPIVNEIVSQVGSLSQVLTNMNKKINSSDKDLKQLSDIEKENVDSMRRLRESFDRLMSQIEQPRFNSQLENEIENNQTFQLQELKIMNDKLQRELQLSADKFTSLKLENQHLQAQVENKKTQEKFVITSPSFSNQQQRLSREQRHLQSSPPYENEVFQQQQQRLSLLETENYNLSKQIKSLTRQLEEKSQQLEKIGHDFITSPKGFQPNNQTASLDQVLFHQEQHDKQVEKTKNLLKLTQKFLYAMKKLQKAVHRKEVNVQKEKAEFESTRKDLETVLKSLKKEFEVIENVQNAAGGVRASSIGRISNDDQPNIQSKLNKYQSNNPNTFQSQNRKASISKKQNSQSYNTNQQLQQPQIQNTSQVHKHSINPYSVNQSLGVSSIMNENHNSIFRDRSPIPLRNKFTSARNGLNDNFHSIEPYEKRGRDPLLSSLERPSQQRSPSVNAYDNYHKISLDQSQPQLQTTIQINNMRNEIDLLHQEIKDLLSEREMMNDRIVRVEQEKDALNMDLQLIEKQLDREVKKSEAARRELNELELEKETLLNEYKRLRQQFQPESLNDRDLQESLEKNEKLFEQLQILERMSNEQKRTIQFLEESADSAKNTITDLKEALSQKDLEIQELQKELEDKSLNNRESTLTQNNNRTVSDSDFRKLKTQLLEKIDEIEQENQIKFQYLESELKGKEHEINKLKRQLDRKLKEKEIQLQSQQQLKSSNSQDPQLLSRISDLESLITGNQLSSFQSIKYVEKERQIKQYEDKKLEEIVSAQEKKVVQQENQIKNLQQNIQELEGQLSDQTKQLKKDIDKKEEKFIAQLQKEKENYEKSINKLKNDHTQQLQTLQQNEQENLENQLSEIQQQHQNELQTLLHNHQQQLKDQQSQLRSEHEKKIKLLTEQHNNLIKDLQQEMDRKVQEERNLAIQLQNKDQQENLKKIQEADKKKWDAEKSKLEALLKTEKENVQEQKQEIDELNKDFEFQLQYLNEQIETQQNESTKQLQQKDTLINQLKQQAHSQKTELESQLEELKRQYENEKQDLEYQIQQEQEKLNDLRKERDSAISAKDKEIQGLKQQEQRTKDQLNNELSKKQQEIDELQERIQELEDTVHQTQSEGTTQTISLQKQVENQKLQIKQKEQEIKNMNIEIQENQEAIDDLNSQINDLQSQLDSQLNANKQVQNELNNEKQKSQKSMQELQGKNEKLAREKETLREQLEQMELNEQQIQDQLNNAQTQIEDLKKNLTLSQTKQKDLSSQLQDHQDKYNALLMERDGMASDMETYQDNQNKLSEQLQKEQSVKEQLNQKIAEMIKQSQLKQGQLEKDLTTKINELTQQNDELKVENERLNQQVDDDKNDYESKLQHLNSQLSSLNQEVDKKDATINDKEHEIKNLRQQLTDIENESKYANSIKQSIQQQLEKLQKEAQDKEAQLSTVSTQLSSKLQEKEATLQEQEDAIQDLQQQIDGLKSQIDQVKQEKQKLEKHNEHEIQELNKKMQNVQNEKEQLKNELESKLKLKDQSISELQLEKQTAQDSLKDMINQTKFEKQSLQEQLQIQLTNTLAQLQQKEQDLIQKDQEFQQVESQLRDALNKEQENQQRVKELEDENEQYMEEIQALEEQRGKHQQTLENNRNLIQMLKNELQKSIDKQKLSEKEKELTDTEKDQEHNTQVQKLQQQIVDLRNNYEDQIMDLKLQIDTLEQDQRQKQELIDGADLAIQEYYDDKNEIRAKFKHLQQLLEGVDEESSYKEEDDVDLEKCFDMFEKEFMKNRRKVESKIESLEKENSMLKQQLLTSKSELDQMEGKMIDIQLELTKAVQKQEQNDGEMRKQIETAQRKYQNYKDKLIEKQKQLNQLEIEKKHRDESQAQSREQSVMKENLELLQKLQRAENELQNYRLANQRGLAGRIGGTPNDLSQDESFRVDAQRIKQIEDQLINLRKQLFQAKDQVIDQMTDLFARRIKELTNTYQKDHLLRAKLSEMKTDAQIQALNNNIKLIKVVNVFNKRLMIVQVVNNSECYVIDEAKLSESSVLYLKSYLPAAESELNESFLQIDEKQQLLVDKLESQIKEIREERQELQQELQVYKSKLFGGQAFEDMKELKVIELEDDVGHLNAENMELRQKMKEVISKNTLQQIRIIELNETIRDLTSKSNPDSANRKLIKLKEDNESLRQELMKQQSKKKQSIHLKSQQRFNPDADDDLEEGSFLEGIKVADNMMNTSQNEHNNNNLFDQSSLYDVIGDLEEEKNNKHQQLAQTVERLKNQIDELQSKNRTLQSEVQKSQQSLNPNEMSVINHIKGTLMQFLKNCPITDKNNEGLLTVIFSIMEFQKEDIEEIQDYRKKGGHQNRGNSVSSGHMNTEEDIKKKTGKGILGKMFKKKEKESSVQRQPPSQDDPNIFSPIRPIKRN